MRVSAGMDVSVMVDSSFLTIATLLLSYRTIGCVRQDHPTIVFLLTKLRKRSIFSLLRGRHYCSGDCMKEIISTITSKGQVTIPAEVRQYLGIATNDKIAFVIDDEGTVRLRIPRYPTVASLRGAAGSLKKPLSWQEIQQTAYEDRIKAKYESQ